MDKDTGVRIKLTDFHKQGIEKWGSFFGETEVLQLYPPTESRIDGGYGTAKFATLEKDRYQSTEFWCAMEYLDDLNVPRVDESNGETYSIVGRIMWLKNNK